MRCRRSPWDAPTLLIGSRHQILERKIFSRQHHEALNRIPDRPRMMKIPMNRAPCALGSQNAQNQSQRTAIAFKACQSSRSSARTGLICLAKKEKTESQNEQRSAQQGLAAAALAASILVAAAAIPGDALAARSGGRVGGSSFRSAPRSAAPRAAPQAGPTVRNYNYNYSPAPPLIGGYGYGGYGYGGGISLFPTFVTPIGGGIFQFFIFAIVASTILGALRTVFSRQRDNDEWDD